MFDDADGKQVSLARFAGKPVLFFSLEMPRLELANRMLCAEARVDQGRVRACMLASEDMNALTSAASKLFSLPIYIDDSGDLTLLELRAKARRMKNERDLALIVIDYLQLMKASREGMESREREISEISRGLKALAKELGPSGIRVNAIAPGLVETKFAAALFQDKEGYERLMAGVPLRRYALAKLRS